MDLRALAAEVSSYKADRLRACGWTSVLPNGDAVARGSVRPDLAIVAGYAGLSTCGSTWRCAVCGAKIAYLRAEDLGWVLEWAKKNGHTVAMATLTMRHNRKHRLADSWNAATTAWGRITSGRRWAKIKDRFGLLGWARAMEATYGEMFGWHPHIHAILVLEGPVSPGMVRELGEQMFSIWEKGLARKGYTALRDSGGLDIRVSTEATEQRLAEYFVKQLAVEATHGAFKEGRQHGLTPLQILAAFGATGDMAYLALWHEWERASYGRQQLTWSMGLREMAGLAAEEVTDDEAAAEEAGGGEDLLQLPAATWRVIRPKSWELLDVIETEGLVGAERWLRVRGLGYGVIRVPGVAPP
jgi:replication protein